MVLQITNRQRRFRIREKTSLLSRVDNSPSLEPIHLASRIRHVSRTFPASMFESFGITSDFEVQLVTQRAVKKQERRKVVSYSRKGSVQRGSLNTKSDFLTCFM